MPQRTLISSIIIIFFSFFFILVVIWITIANSSSEIHSTSITGFDKPVGVWGPFSNSGHNLEQLKGITQSRAISDIITQGFDEYYFVMSNFEDPKLIDSTESLLQSAENLDQGLKIIIILLPPSEGGPDGNYDWEVYVVINEFLDYVDGIVAVSGCYYDVSALEPQLHLFGELFDNKPMKFVVYPTITHNYTRQYYSPPSDRLVISTLSIVSRTVDGILIWHKIDSPVIQEYLKNIDINKAYISKMNRMEEIQIKDELEVGTTVSTETEKNCLEWYKKYLHAYNYWLSLDSVQKKDDSLKEKLLSFINYEDPWFSLA